MTGTDRDAFDVRPSPDELLERYRSEAIAARGRLRLYLGMAPGVGKTYRMLEEGHRRAGRGTDVVVGFVEAHGRPLTTALVDGLEVVPRRSTSHRGMTVEEMDTDAVIARHPTVVLVDELAHTNTPGSPRAKRWEDVEVIRAAGIHVVSTMNIQHLESLSDAVATITGAPVNERLPDDVLLRADEIELVDMSPHALRHSSASGSWSLSMEAQGRGEPSGALRHWRAPSMPVWWRWSPPPRVLTTCHSTGRETFARRSR
jgi:two-component system sensor histidine kinase KdpD